MHQANFKLCTLRNLKIYIVCHNKTVYFYHAMRCISVVFAVTREYSCCDMDSQYCSQSTVLIIRSSLLP